MIYSFNIIYLFIYSLFVFYQKLARSLALSTVSFPEFIYSVFFKDSLALYLFIFYCFILFLFYFLFPAFLCLFSTFIFCIYW